MEFFKVVTSFCKLLFETNNFGLGSVPLLCLVSELREMPPLGLKFRKTFRSFNLSNISSWSQEISMPILVQIYQSVFKLQANIHSPQHIQSLMTCHAKIPQVGSGPINGCSVALFYQGRLRKYGFT
jgi:hypothetical protein